MLMEKVSACQCNFLNSYDAIYAWVVENVTDELDWDFLF
jgi:hypothetical protein